MTREEVINAFRESATQEFYSIPNEDEIEYEFSASFLRKMEKLIKEAQYNFTHSVSLGKRNLFVLVAVITIFLCSIMSVSATRDAAVKFFLQMFDDFAEIVFVGEKTYHIEYEFSFFEIPQGFSETNYVSADEYREIQYQNDETGELIIFSQGITGAMQGSYDTEHGKISNVEVNGMVVSIYEKYTEDICIATWECDGYLLEIVYYGECSQEKLIELISLVR